MEASFALVILIVFFAFFAQAATGFGGMLIALTLGALLFPVKLLLIWLVPQSALLSVYLLLRHHGHIDWQLFLKKILPGMGVGMVIGQGVFYGLDTVVLRYALGLVVMLLAGRELLRQPAVQRRINLLPWTVTAGIVHGVFATGGPVLVYALNALNIPKGVFRSTLAAVWLTMAAGLMASYSVAGQLSSDALPQIGTLAATLPFSIWLGEKAHRRIDEAVFRKVINILLILCGLALLLK